MSPISGLITMKSIDEIYEEEAAEARNQTAEDVEKRHSNKPHDKEDENDTNEDAANVGDMEKSQLKKSLSEILRMIRTGFQRVESLQGRKGIHCS